MEITGEIIGIIYRNDIDSYTIAEIYKAESKETMTIVGYLPFIAEGDTIKAIGKMVEHKDYGEQFKIETFEKIMPQTLDGLERYIGNGTIQGVGPSTAKKIVEKFGKDTIDIIKNYPEELSTIKGISRKKALEISESFTESFEVWRIVEFLQKYGIGIENAKKIYDILGTTAISQIEENPYILIDLVRGVDFKQIDRKALELGLDLTSIKRITSGIKYSLIQATYNGHSCVLLENLEEYVSNLLGISLNEVEESIINLNAKGEIVIEERQKGIEWVYLGRFYDIEMSICKRILDLDNCENLKKVKNIDKKMQKTEDLNTIELSKKQKEAIKAVNDNNVTIITGGPGTGKTTIIKSIIQIYTMENRKIVLAAPTGRAAKRMTEMTEKEASTLHRLLEIGKISEETLYENNKDYKGTPIDADVIIVDEVSMVDLVLMDCLLQSIYKGTKLILVGDSDQLPSVGPGSVLEDIIESNRITTIHLDKIFRQAAKSKIIVNAHRVNSGEKFITKNDEEQDSKQDFFFINEQNQEEILKQIISLCTGRLEKFGNYDFFNNIQILTPTKKGMLGTKELNKALQQVLNPNDDEKKEKSSQGAIYRVGDRIMQTKNNYDIYWEKYVTNEEGMGIFNGEFGTITNIDEKEKNIEIKFDDEKVAWYQFTDLEQIEHSYAITIHKAQRK